MSTTMIGIVVKLFLYSNFLFDAFFNWIFRIINHGTNNFLHGHLIFQVLEAVWSGQGAEGYWIVKIFIKYLGVS